jgi:signal transduction histidine kinase
VEIDSSDEIGDLARAFQMTRQLAEQRERLLQSERVAAWRELARRLAHELKNPSSRCRSQWRTSSAPNASTPISSKKSFARALRPTGGARESQDHHRPLQRFRQNAGPAVRARSVERSGARGAETFEAQLAASGAIRPEANLDQRLPAIQADPEQIKRALQNLVLNAMDAMPSGGTLLIETRQYNSTVILEVSDTGQGLTREECNRLFTPYYTTKHHGTGLGLAIVQSVVSDHHGTISVESQPGHGATFRIELPITHAVGAARA